MVVYYLGENAWTMNRLKGSIANMVENNTEGKYDEAILKEKALFRSFMNEIIGRPEAVGDELAA